MADLVARVAGLWRYPVKSCAGEAVDALELDADGRPEGERGWAVVDAAGELSWMGAQPRLALVAARLRADGLTLLAQGRLLTLAADAGEAVQIRAWNGERQDFDTLQAWDAGDDAAALLRATTGARLRLVRLSAAARRSLAPNALHLVGDGSLRAWREALAQPLNKPAERARANLLLRAEDGGELPPFIEDILVEARVADGPTLRRTSACVRCTVPAVDPTSGKPQPAALEALTLLSTERAPGAPVQFGIYAGGSGGRLSVGDRVELTLDFGE
ncbi:MOSC N-terminal beta barrel domain-containing protein [Roseateles sp.]|uniref:MOSC N-terminal beta barrel domain-containing protein n=1 Tax=Roseateles sp. TaxID=1971397 RepID=UPI0025E0E7BD|nr:MOSC N-terminal beta barrel domain-containing protein [Roseateles sp.]MBV8036332.1 MOSC N-terminal beta barrel domain-containing protein [Roseateles sp.]